MSARDLRRVRRSHEAKLMPALYNLRQGKLLTDRFAVIGVSRSPMSDEEFRQRAAEDLQEATGGKPTASFCRGCSSACTTCRSTPKIPPPMRSCVSGSKRSTNSVRLAATSSSIWRRRPSCSGRPSNSSGESGLTAEHDGHFRRVVIEKPFGHDLDSARSLNHEILQVLRETQIYRIDHYLGKETVQNILAFRFGNGIFEPIWNRRYIDHVQINASPRRVGVEQRGGYYDTSGALRDMVPNHLFQLVSLTAMEPPISFEANAVRDEQAKVLHAIQPFTPEDVLRRSVRGQYGDGMMDGRNQRGYRHEDKVRPDSTTETFVALKLFIDNWRWADVPFYLRTGKMLPKRETEITIQFKRAPFQLFRDTPVEKC